MDQISLNRKRLKGNFSRHLLPFALVLFGHACSAQLPSCSNGTITVFPIIDDFEFGIIYWNNINGDEFDWLGQSGGTLSPSTGPSSGAEGSTYYMYIETSDPRVLGDEAILQTWNCMNLNGLTNPTMTFDYHMYGSTIGGLELLISTDGSTWNSLWTLTGNQGDSWNLASIDLSAYLNQTVGFRFIGTRGTSYTGDIALDNIWIGNIVPLSVESSKFKADSDKSGHVNLLWTTDSENDNDYFTVERSMDGISWEEVEIIDGAGNSNSTIDYRAEDNSPYQGTSYYRLRQTDFQSESSFSNIETVTIQSNWNVRVYPNPVSENLRCVINSSKSSKVAIEICDNLGRAVIQEEYGIQKGQNILNTTVSSLNNGCYYLRVSSSNESINFQKKIIRIWKFTSD